MGSERAQGVALASLLFWGICLGLPAGHAEALANDLEIPALGSPTDPAAVERFRMLSDELGMTFAGTTLEPARTIGIDGFDLSLEVAVVFINATTQIGGQSYWSTSSPASAPLIVPALHIRKGLPYSFEIGGRVLTIADSGLFAGQAEVKWGIVEGFRYIPDLSARLAVTQLFSQQDLDLTTGSAEITLAKELGIGGLVALTPYLGYCLTAVEADSRPFWVGAVTEQQYLQNPLANQERFAPISGSDLGWNDNLYDRFYLGLQLQADLVSFNAEYSISLPSALSGASFPVRPPISTLGLRLGLAL